MNAEVTRTEEIVCNTHTHTRFGWVNGWIVGFPWLVFARLSVDVVSLFLVDQKAAATVTLLRLFRNLRTDFEVVCKVSSFC